MTTKTKTPLDIALEAESAAYRLVRLAEADRDDEIMKAREAITDKWQEKIADLKGAHWEACSATIVARLEATTDHEWESKIVRRELRGAYRHSMLVNRPKVYERGMVVTYRPGVELPSNTPRYRFPTIGDALVFPLKKDGKPGVKFERLTQSWELEP